MKVAKTSHGETSAWLTEHLFYEWTMLHHTIDKVVNAKISNGQEQLEYNTNYVAFMVHARNMYWFLTNRVEQGDYSAHDFVQNFKSPKTDLTKSVSQRVNPQVFHLDEERPALGPDKINSADCYVFFSWLVVEFRRFESQLPSPIRSAWVARIGSAPPTVDVRFDAGAAPYACTIFTSATSGTPSKR